jgi:hypothetical protein
MSNTKYTDPTNAEDPPGGKRHDTAKNDASADKLPTEEGQTGRGSERKTATSPKTVANTEK